MKSNDFSEIGVTESVCPECLEVIPARKIVRDDGIYMVKKCPEHGEYEALIWEGSVESYEAWGKNLQPADKIPAAKEVEKGCPQDCGLCAAHERRGCCVLLEVTSRCNLCCPVCFASAGEQGQDTPLEELEKQMEYLMEHGGPFNIQLSGGEPTVRDDLPEIIRTGRKIGFTFFQLNTNGLRLADEPGYADKLKEAGLSCVFLQFDGMNDEVYKTLRGKPLLDKKIAAIDACARAGLGVVLVPVIAPGVNEDQVGAILSYAKSRMPYVRGVHFQPISYFGRCVEEQGSYRVTLPKMLLLMEQQTDGVVRAEHFTGGNATNPYCTFQANYLRQPDGSMKPMMHAAARATASSEQAREFVARQWSGAQGNCCCGEPEPAVEEESCCCCCGEETEEKTESCCCGEPEPAAEEESSCCCCEEVEEKAESCCCGELESATEEESSCCCCGEEAEEKTESSCCGEPEPAAEEESCCCCGEAAEEESGGCCCGEDTAQLQLDLSSLDDFLVNIHNNTFAVSGMLFQDAYNLDLERLKRCYILETDSRYGMVPFCAYNLTSIKGRTLYR